MSPPPAVSVVVPAHNAGRWIGESVGSLLAQSMPDLEIIVVDDASTDDTAELICAIADPRVRLVRNEHNMGVSASRNRGIEVATGEFLAFMDADDIALPHRFEKQVAFLRANPEVSVLGGWMQTFGRRDDIWSAWERHDDIKAELLYACALLQSTVVCRRERFVACGLRYDPTLSTSEDYYLWTRCADVLRLANLPEVLVRYRTHEDNVSLVKRQLLVETNRTIRLQQLRKLGVQPDASEAEFHTRLFEYGPNGPGKMTFDLDRVEAWLLRLREANRHSGYVSERALDIVLYEFWRRCCKRDEGSRATSWRFIGSSIARTMPFARRFRDTAKFLLNAPHYPVPRG